MATRAMAAGGRAVLSAGVWQRLRAIADDPSLAAEEHRIMHAAGVSGGPLRALRHLPISGSMPMRELAAEMGCDNSYVTSLVDILEDRGLARRAAHPSDRRIKVIVLTESGQRVAAEVQRAHATAPERFDRLTKAELTALDHLLEKLDS